MMLCVAPQELEDANNKLIKAKMSSVVKDESRSSTDRELRLQQLQQRLHTVRGDLYASSQPPGMRDGFPPRLVSVFRKVKSTKL